MKKLFLFSAVVFLIGLVLKIFHVHYNAIIMLAAVFLMLVAAIAGGTGKKRGFPLLFTIPFVAGTLALVFMIKFYPGHLPVFYVAVAVLLGAIVVLLIKREWSPAFFLVPVSVILVWLHFTPAYKIYYLFNIRYNYEIETDYRSWDKYSWFLYRAGNMDEALKVSAYAIWVAKKSGQNEAQKAMENHHEKIMKRTWDHYDDGAGNHVPHEKN